MYDVRGERLDGLSWNSVFVYVARQSGLRRFRGDASLPECPQFTFRPARPRISIQTPGNTVGRGISLGNYTEPSPASHRPSQ